MVRNNLVEHGTERTISGLNGLFVIRQKQKEVTMEGDGQINRSIDRSGIKNKVSADIRSILFSIFPQYFCISETKNISGFVGFFSLLAPLMFYNNHHFSVLTFCSLLSLYSPLISQLLTLHFFLFISCSPLADSSETYFDTINMLQLLVLFLKIELIGSTVKNISVCCNQTYIVWIRSQGHTSYAYLGAVVICVSSFFSISSQLSFSVSLIVPCIFSIRKAEFEMTD